MTDEAGPKKKKTEKKWFTAPDLGKWVDRIPLPKGRILPERPVTKQEVEALRRYVMERSVDGTSEALIKLNAALLELAAVVDDNYQASEVWQDVMRQYDKIAGITYRRFQVNGRTIIESRSQPSVRQISAYLVFFVMLGLLPIFEAPLMQAMGFEADWKGTASPSLFFTLFDQVIPQAAPFFWGGIGACVYLLKRVADRAAALQYDSGKVQGIFTRIILGAVLGGVVVGVFGLEVSVTQTSVAPGTEAGVPGGRLPGEAVAFLAGLGQKAVFDSIEALISGISGFVKGRAKSPR